MSFIAVSGGERNARWGTSGRETKDVEVRGRVAGALGVGGGYSY